ncbi:MAG: recombinase family protein [Defluviitaleaceae bacterium]|nr:recombinase family protein [Defluviitaleaceae bacterium]
MKNIYAYVRVSSNKQNEARQVKELLDLGILKNNIIIEKATGKNFNRNKYNNLLKCLNSGDILYISSIDRLGRDYDGIISEWNRLIKEMKVAIRVLDMPLLNTDKDKTNLMDKFICDIVLMTLAFQAEQEWNNIKSRQKAGIAIAKENGKKLGRPKAIYPEATIKTINEWKNGILSLDEAMKKIGRKKSTFYRLVQELK